MRRAKVRVRARARFRARARATPRWPALRSPQAIIDLHTRDGLAVGTSAGINVAGAMQVARQIGPGHTVATVLCDRADRYASKLFDADFLRSKALRVPPWLEHGSAPKARALFSALRDAALATPAG